LSQYNLGFLVVTHREEHANWQQVSLFVLKHVKQDVFRAGRMLRNVLIAGAVKESMYISWLIYITSNMSQTSDGYRKNEDVSYSVQSSMATCGQTVDIQTAVMTV
jgi:hypothetical protein